MIGRLAGTLAGLGDDGALVDVQGVGYVVACGPRTLADLPGIGRPVTLLIETQVREDAIRLFGFLTETERDWFRLLQSVQGVGAKVALAILSTLAVPELSRAVALGDKTAVARSPGVGPKLAARIVAELKDKVPAAIEALQAPSLKAAVQKPKGAPAEALSALVNLGYGQSEAAEALAAVLPAAGDAAEVAVLIRLALKELAR